MRSKTYSITVLCACTAIFYIICLAPGKSVSQTTAPVAGAPWVPISDGVLKQLSDSGKKIGYPGGTAGVCVDRTTGDVYMIVPDQGIWKSSDRGATFARADGGALGGRCETGYTLNPDPAGKRLAAFMLDGQAVVMSGAGKSWKPLAQHGRGWDYGTADWSSPDPRTLLAVHHESGEELHVSTDAGSSWKLIGKDYTGLGIFDDHTFVATKGAGILRSVDSGATWTKASDLTPTGRVLCVLNGTGYWVSREGLLASSDKGLTWHKQGSPIEAAWGPFFGRNAKQIVVVGRLAITLESTWIPGAKPGEVSTATVPGIPGFYRSDDAGKTWKLAAQFPAFEKESIPDWTPGKQWAAGWFCCFGWDPIGNIFYASRMGHPTFKFAAP